MHSEMEVGRFIDGLCEWSIDELRSQCDLGCRELTKQECFYLVIRGIQIIDRIVTEFRGQIMRLQGVLKTMVVDRDGHSERAFRRGR